MSYEEELARKEEARVRRNIAYLHTLTRRDSELDGGIFSYGTSSLLRRTTKEDLT